MTDVDDLRCDDYPTCNCELWETCAACVQEYCDGMEMSLDFARKELWKIEKERDAYREAMEDALVFLDHILGPEEGNAARARTRLRKALDGEVDDG